MSVKRTSALVILGISIGCLVCAVALVLGVRAWGQGQRLNRGTGVSVFDIALQRITTFRHVRKFCKAFSVSQSEFECVWIRGGECPFPVVGLPVRIVAGGNAADDSDGDGARSIEIFGCETGTWNEISEILSTNGANVSLETSQSFIRINEVKTEGSGLYHGLNVGEISIEQSDGILEMAVIGAELGITDQAFYSVCAGGAFIPTVLSITADANKSANIRGYRLDNADIVSAPFSSPYLVFQKIISAGSFSFQFPSPGSVGSHSDLWLEAMSTGGSPLDITAQLDGTRALDPS